MEEEKIPEYIKTIWNKKLALDKELWGIAEGIDLVKLKNGELEFLIIIDDLQKEDYIREKVKEIVGDERFKIIYNDIQFVICNK